jgi:hypothetical protein
LEFISELILFNVRSANLTINIEEGIYALIGAASTVAAATKTISPAIMVWEITGQISHIVPVLLGVLLANLVVNNLAMSAFDVILEFKNLPYLATLGSVSIYKMKAKDLMNRNFFYLTKESRIAEIPVIISKVKGGSM